MTERNVESKEGSRRGIVDAILTPFGSQAYKESRERGQGRLKSVINGLVQACMPATYGMAETINADKNQSTRVVGMTAAVIADASFNFLALIAPAEYALLRYAYGQLATRIRGLGDKKL